ncbi:hypothetical protein ACH4TQ_46780 [Streptomyces sp. NPDC021218]|uniref:hypothetical protein n=1 Tax=Streptomyces sp. NPDC021218 TaxID=3365119 RepID=UPI0037954A54
MGVVEDATRAELDQLGVVATSPGLTEAALKLARQLDDTDKPTSAAVVARELRGLMADLRRLAPVDEGEDAVNDIARQREKRRAAAREQASGG